MKLPRKATATRAILAISVSILTAQLAAAQTANNAVVGNLPTCSTMLTNCINFSQRAIMAAGPGGTIPDNITESACHRMGRKAQETGVWPDNQPFGFSEACITTVEQSGKHRRHRMFRFQNTNSNATAIPDPAALPTTPPLAAEATNGD